MPKKTATKKKHAATIGFEQKLWLAADKLRSNMDASEYKHVVLGLIFLKYISDAFEYYLGTVYECRGKGESASLQPRLRLRRHVRPV